MPCFSTDASVLFANDGKEEMRESLEKNHAELLALQVDYVEYGKPETLPDLRRARLNCELLKQVLIHRAERLMVASGITLAEKNLYGLALVVRGHIETVAVLGYFTRRLNSLIAKNITFEQFQLDIANGLLGAKHDLFDKASAPVNVLTCVQHADKYMDAILFQKKQEMIQDLYGWLSEFAHPNFCSNKSAYDMDHATGRMLLRKNEGLGNDHFQMLATLRMSADFLAWFIPEYTTHLKVALPEE